MPVSDALKSLAQRSLDARTKALCRELARRGWDLWMVSNEAGPLAETAREISSEWGCQCRTTCIDLGQDDAAGQLFRESEEQGLTVGLLVNDAGIFSFFKKKTV